MKSADTLQRYQHIQQQRDKILSNTFNQMRDTHTKRVSVHVREPNKGSKSVLEIEKKKTLRESSENTTQTFHFCSERCTQRLKDAMKR